MLIFSETVVVRLIYVHVFVFVLYSDKLFRCAAQSFPAKLEKNSYLNEDLYNSSAFNISISDLPFAYKIDKEHVDTNFAVIKNNTEKYSESTNDFFAVTHIGDFEKSNFNSVVSGEIYYNVSDNLYKIAVINANAATFVEISGLYPEVSYIIAQVHSQSQYLIISQNNSIGDGYIVNNTHCGLVLPISAKEKLAHFYIFNLHLKNLSVLLIVRNYTAKEAVPGADRVQEFNSVIPLPFLSLKPNLLTTLVSFLPATSPNASYELIYDVYLMYSYEGSLRDEQYWNALILTSTVDSLKENAVLVSSHSDDTVNNTFSNLFVSYSGVGAVITVLVSANGSHGALYTSSVSYGCDFIPGEEYKCTKLINTLAQFFCASLLFIGGILLMFGHRWLNFTMFCSGFFMSWLILVVAFSQLPQPNINALGYGTLFGAVIGGIVCLYLWHRFQRPLYSALPIILLNAFFAAMVILHCLEYTMMPSSRNLPAMVVFPIILAICIVALAFCDIKRVHIFSCTFLGSYIFIVPFAFYFASSLTYIVINVVAAMTVVGYTTAVGYPPFQHCDAVLVSVWIFAFVTGFVYQLIRERSSPPFAPPNLASWRTMKSMLAFLYNKMALFCGCCPLHSNESYDIESTPKSVKTYLIHGCSALCPWLMKGDIRTAESNYESLPRDNYFEEDTPNSLHILFRKCRAYLMRRSLYDHEPLQTSAIDDEDLDGVGACSFKSAKMVLSEDD